MEPPGLLRPDQIAGRVQLDEVACFAIAGPGTLIGRVVIDRLARVVGDVGDPVGKAWQVVGDAWALLKSAPAFLTAV
jgi:hypothetical protein